MDQSKIYQAAFASVRGLNRLLAGQILQRTGSEQAFFEASESRLRALTGYRNKIFDDAYRASLVENARAEVEFTDFSGIRRIYYTDADYPQRLAQCDDAPLMLYSLGALPPDDGLFLGIVGTRHATPYGIDFTERVVESLARQVDRPLTIVSGLALGIDIVAHRAAMRAGLPTVAVLAHGLNTIYPASHRREATEIARGAGCLLTEYTSKSVIHRANFLARNRIVAGLCDCLLVVESAEKGGALTTARIAADYHRDVFALPGRTSDRFSAGCNRLIASNSAALVTSADDIIDAMGWPRKPEGPQQQQLFEELSPDERAILDILEANGDTGINRLSVETGLNVGRLTAMLIDMEFRGLVLKYPGGKYRKA